MSPIGDTGTIVPKSVVTTIVVKAARLQLQTQKTPDVREDRRGSGVEPQFQFGG